jgi:KDO2-lipid IV(A) lauroyltransferase
MSPPQIRRMFRLKGVEKLAANVAAGRGQVVALPHAGNWDAAGAWVAAHGWPITTVAERLRPEALFERFLAYRQGLGMEIIPLTGGARPPIDVLAERVRQGHMVPLLADRDLSARGVEVTFFGGPTRMPAGPALLALRTGAPLYVCHMWYEPDGPRGHFDGPLEVPDPASGPLDQRVRVLTQRIADTLATGIAAHPQDWHMLQRLWLDAGAGQASGASQASGVERLDAGAGQASGASQASGVERRDDRGQPVPPAAASEGQEPAGRDPTAPCQDSAAPPASAGRP